MSPKNPRKKDQYDLSHKRGILHQQNWSNRFVDFHAPVSLAVIVLVVIFVTFTIGWQEQASTFFISMKNWINNNAGWFYILSLNAILVAVLYFAFSPYGEIRLGGKLARPEFKTGSWLAMLLACGMGIGLVFYSVAEPMYHASSIPPYFGDVESGSIEAYRNAMVTTFYHWGLHPWGVYALLAIALAFFAFNRKLPLSIRSVFYPILKDRIFKWPGHVIDILAILATLLGLATSLGLGASQIGTGLSTIFPSIPNTRGVNIVLITVITLIATLSVVTGLKKGIQFLSNLNMIIAGFLLLLILVLGPTQFILGSFVENIGTYLRDLVPISFWTESYDNKYWSEGGGSWQSGWTVFYWGWWVSWSPFVSTFIARISFGRTIREMAIGVLLAPVLMSFFWLTVTGNVAIWEQLRGVEDLVSAVNKDLTSSFFVFLGGLPALAGMDVNSDVAIALVKFLSLIAVTVTAIFFITSSDSGSMVVDLLAAGGKLGVPVAQKVFWALMEGTLAITLLLAGSSNNILSALSAMQAGVIATGLPFALILLVSIFSLRKGFYNELHRIHGDDAPETLWTTETYEDKEKFYGPEEEVIPEG